MIVPEEPEDSLQINIVPMIDVIFAILTFFIMASLFLTRSEGLPVNLPTAKTAQTQSDRITVTIDPEGDVLLNRNSIEVSELADAVRALMRNDADALIVINADEKVEHGQVITVMDELRTIEGARLGIATQRPRP